ncbi:MAG: hypothetical protein DHS20C01_14480 [marine bacterium B5-7]|nr:MAG: hypothetical protein DHS20C01_14480 [marine bacterium B5-7]
MSTGTVRITDPIMSFNTPDLLDTLARPAYAGIPLPEPEESFPFSVCIRLNRVLGLYDAFVIVNDEGNFPSYRGTALPSDPANETDSDLTFDGDCGDASFITDKLYTPAYANGLGVQIRVFNVSDTGTDVEVEINTSRWTGFLEWNDFSCGLSCGELELPELLGSDRNIKDNFVEVDENSILEKVAALPVEYWNYTDRDVGIRHIGPMAQDFQAAFNVGDSDRYIHMVDANGINLASIKALYKHIQEKDEKIASLEQDLQEIKKALGLS